MLVLKLGINPDYVLDKMQIYEMKSLLKYSHYKHSEDWEQTRLIGYIIAQCNSTKRLKMENIVKFPWEGKEGENKKGEIMSDEEMKRMRAKAKAIIDNGLI